MEQLLNATYTNGYEDDLVAELLDDVSPIFVPTQDIEKYYSSPYSFTPLISTDFPVPAIEDFENALSHQNNFHASSDTHSRTSFFEKGQNKIENKYTLRIKIYGNSMVDDGYKWRKYGQKSIKNSPNPRSYYKCTNRRCSAKKQVELSSEEKDTFIVTYEGLHLHYADTYFMLGLDQQSSPLTKKPKITTSKAQAHDHIEAQGREALVTEELDAGPTSFNEGPFIGPIEDLSPQGLLEDMVPFIVRNPKNNYGSSSSCSSYPSLPDSPSSHSWSDNYFSTLFDIGL